MALSNVAARSTDVFVSALDFVHNRDIYYKLFRRYPGESAMDFFELNALVKPATQTEVHHFEEDFIFENAVVLTFGANADGATGGDQPGAGSPIYIKLDPVSHEGNDIYPMVGNLVQFKNLEVGFIQAINIAAPTAQILKIQRLDTGVDWPVGTFVIADTFMIYTNAHAEGTGQPATRSPKFLKFTFIHQIFKHSYAITGSEDTNDLEFEIEGKPYYAIKGEADTADRFKMEEELGLLINPAAVNLTNDAGEAIRITKGLLPSIRQNGNKLEYPTSMTIPDFDTIIKRLDKNFGSKENIFYQGIDLSLDIKNIMTDLMKSGGIQYNAFGGGDKGKQRALTLGFNSIELGNYVFHYHVLRALNHPRLTASPGFKYSKLGFIIPTDTNRDPKTGNMVESICLRYKQGNNYVRSYKRWETGANARIPTNDIDERRIHYMSEKALQVFGLNRFLIVEQA